MVYTDCDQDTMWGYLLFVITRERNGGSMKKEQDRTAIEESGQELGNATCHCAKRECSGKTKTRSEKEFNNLMNRLKRIEGQVRGIENMLENNAYCTDVMVQVAAVNAALNSFNKALLTNHVKTCVAENIREGNDEVIDELVILLQKLMR